MGVPSYFSYLIRNHKEMLIKIFNFKKQINNLYFDSNSIIYDALRNLSKDYDTFESSYLYLCNNLDITPQINRVRAFILLWLERQERYKKLKIS